jgi:hypothetical protein
VTVIHNLRDPIRAAVAEVLRPRPEVLAGWEGGSAAFGTIDAYSDIDLNFLVTDEVSLDVLHEAVEGALNAVSPIVTRHAAPPGCYYALRDAGEYLLVDLCFFRVGASDHHLDADRHGEPKPLFDKADWLRAPVKEAAALASARRRKLIELHEWFVVSQGFVRKALLRGLDADAMASFWGYTLRPLADLLRLRYCPARWDFGMRYLERDLPVAVHLRFCDLLFVRDLADLEVRFAQAGAWGAELLAELAASEKICQ